MRTYPIRLLFILLLIPLNFVQAANTLEDGIAAYREKHYQNALDILEPLTKQNNPRASLFVGHVYLYADDPLFFNPELGVQYYKKAADAGVSEALYQLGKLTMLQLGGTELPFSKTDRSDEEKWRRALPYFKAAAEKGHVNAQLVLSNLYYHSMGLEHNSVDDNLYNAYYWGLAAAEQISDQYPSYKKLVWHWLDGNPKDSISKTDYVLIHLKALFSMLPKSEKWPSPDCAIESCVLPISTAGKTIDTYLDSTY